MKTSQDVEIEWRCACEGKVYVKGEAHTSGGDDQPGGSRWKNAYLCAV
jgi:hypothetical protein